MGDDSSIEAGFGGFPLSEPSSPAPINAARIAMMVVAANTRITIRVIRRSRFTVAGAIPFSLSASTAMAIVTCDSSGCQTSAMGNLGASSARSACGISCALSFSPTSLFWLLSLSWVAKLTTEASEVPGRPTRKAPGWTGPSSGRGGIRAGCAAASCSAYNRPILCDFGGKID